jgi:hypothetical protein
MKPSEFSEPVEGQESIPGVSALGLGALACGHAPTEPRPESTTGYGTDPQTGETFCFECCNKREVERIANGATWFDAYVSGELTSGAWLGGRSYAPNGATLTTWPGGTLARVTRAWSSAVERWSDSGPWRMTYLRAVTPDGREWSGCLNAENGNAVTMRALRGK